MSVSVNTDGDNYLTIWGEFPDVVELSKNDLKKLSNEELKLVSNFFLNELNNRNEVSLDCHDVSECY